MLVGGTGKATKEFRSGGIIIIIQPDSCTPQGREPRLQCFGLQSFLDVTHGLTHSCLCNWVINQPKRCTDKTSIPRSSIHSFLGSSSAEMNESRLQNRIWVFQNLDTNSKTFQAMMFFQLYNRVWSENLWAFLQATLAKQPSGGLRHGTFDMTKCQAASTALPLFSKLSHSNASE